MRIGFIVMFHNTYGMGQYQITSTSNYRALYSNYSMDVSQEIIWIIRLKSSSRLQRLKQIYLLM